VPESIMPPYAFLAQKDLKVDDIEARLRTLTRVGVPYTETALKNARADLEAQVDPTASGASLARYYGEKVNRRDFDGDPERLTEMDALVAYLQMLGTLVDFRTYEADAAENLR
jgi:cytochrome c oxidase cbb3-type subunit 2